MWRVVLLDNFWNQIVGVMRKGFLKHYSRPMDISLRFRKKISDHPTVGHSFPFFRPKKEWIVVVSGGAPNPTLLTPCNGQW